MDPCQHRGPHLAARSQPGPERARCAPLTQQERLARSKGAGHPEPRSGRCKRARPPGGVGSLGGGPGGAMRLPSQVKHCGGCRRGGHPPPNHRSIQKEVTRGFCQLIWRLGKGPTVINNLCVLGTDFMHQTKGFKSCCGGQSGFSQGSAAPSSHRAFCGRPRPPSSPWQWG